MEPVKLSRQVLAAVLVNLSSLSVGTSLGWSSPVLPKLMDKDQTPLSEPITKGSAEEAWIASIFNLGAVIGALAAAFVSSKVGRKFTALINGGVITVAFIILLLANKVWMIYVGRTIQGCGVAFMMSSVPIYVAEISSTKWRATMGSIVQVTLILGQIYTFAIGPYISYEALQWACLALPAIFEVTFFFMPETPYYYIQRGNKDGAIKSLMFLRGQSAEAVAGELAEIQASVDESLLERGGLFDIVKTKGNRRALFICAGLFFFAQLSGINSVVFNGQSIFQAATDSIPAEAAALIVPGAQLLVYPVTSALADRVGRKQLLYGSAGLMSAASFGLGACFYLKDTEVDMSKLGWIPIVCVIVFIFGYTGGLGFLPFVAMGEMFPLSVKPIASSCLSIASFVVGFFVTGSYPFLNAVAAYCPFFVYGTSSCIAIIFVFFVVIETRGLSFNEIQHKLNRVH